MSQAGVAVGLEDNLSGQEDLEVGRKGAHVRMLWDLEGVVAGQGADLSFLMVGQVRNLLQLEVVREHHELGAQEEVGAQSVHAEELAAVRNEQVVGAEVPSLERS